MGWNEAYAVRMSGLKNGTHVDVLEALAAIYNVKEKRLFPSTEYIAQVARVSPNVVRKTIKALEAQGLLSVRQNPGCIRYFILHLDALPPPLQAPKKKRTEPLTEVQPLSEVTPLTEVQGDPFQKCEGTPYRSERGPLTEVKPELMNLTKERTNEGNVGRARAPEPPAPGSFSSLKAEMENRQAESLRATRFPFEDLPQEWKTFCESEDAELDPVRVFLEFRDYCLSEGITREDWNAAWRKNVRSYRGNDRIRSKVLKHCKDDYLPNSTMKRQSARDYSRGWDD